MQQKPHGQLPGMPAGSKGHRPRGRAARAPRAPSRPRCTPERRPDRATPARRKNTSTSAADDLSQLMSVITVIDTSELTILAKIPHRREPDGKLICLIERLTR
ncbi:hypothetical protein EVAR_52500_1 [Eumeta japonica]|uniref:Uncharacterized protein n=1 Tax=Eumeta variegata TaxID=151549 RepID=A0A4C1ZNH3_EUMVA|nr:hypothetical protein EVAR_52500_1 [Eumeta japonica]